MSVTLGIFICSLKTRHSALILVSQGATNGVVIPKRSESLEPLPLACLPLDFPFVDIIAPPCFELSVEWYPKEEFRADSSSKKSDDLFLRKKRVKAPRKQGRRSRFRGAKTSPFFST